MTRRKANQLSTLKRTRLWVAPAPRHLPIIIMIMCFVSMTAATAGRGFPSTGPTISTWTQPETGWLYVLDYQHPNEQARVLLVNPEQGSIVGSISVGYNPDMALSPDGGRLYVASVFEDDTLSVIDTKSGTVLQSVTLNNRWPYIERPSAPTLAVSADGRSVYVLKMRMIARWHDEFTVAAFDVERGVFLRREADLGHCMFGFLLPSPDNREVSVVCQGSDDLRVVGRTPAGLDSIASPLPLRPTNIEQANAATLTPTGNVLAVSNDGRIAEIDTPGRRVARMVVSDALADRWIQTRDVARSPDGTRLYIGATPVAERSTGKVSEILVVDVTTGRPPVWIKMDHSFWSMVLSADGKYLYAIDPDTQTVTIIDTQNHRNVRTIDGIGISPLRAIVAP